MSNIIKVRADGPLLCKGRIEVRDAEGGLIESSEDLVLCRCGHSRNKPFCDGSHHDAGFRHDGCFVDERAEPLDDDDAPLMITVRPDAMLVAKGPVTIVSADGRCRSTRMRAALCRCGHSDNKPFCDASHKRCGWRSGA